MVRMFHGGHGRQRVKYSHNWLAAKLLVDSVQDLLHVDHKTIPSMTSCFVQRVLAVIAHVEQHNIVTVQELAPE